MAGFRIVAAILVGWCFLSSFGQHDLAQEDPAEASQEDVAQEEPAQEHFVKTPEPTLEAAEPAVDEPAAKASKPKAQSDEPTTEKKGEGKKRSKKVDKSQNETPAQTLATENATGAAPEPEKK